MKQVSIKVSNEDMHAKKLVIVDGFLIFAVKELADLFDYKLFIDASDYNILIRRLKRDGFRQFNYITDVVIPVSKEYEQIQRDNADVVIDGDRLKDEVIRSVTRFLNDKLLQSDIDFRIKLSLKQSSWKVYFGDLITDHAWHPIDFDNLKEWVRKQKYRLDKGEELKGNTFRYRRNRHSGMYEVRLSPQYRPSICHYTSEPTPV
jgi:hypothetical protein